MRTQRSPLSKQATYVVRIYNADTI